MADGLLQLQTTPESDGCVTGRGGLVRQVSGAEWRTERMKRTLDGVAADSYRCDGSAGQAGLAGQGTPRKAKRWTTFPKLFSNCGRWDRQG